jgi:hypothetical protein
MHFNVLYRSGLCGVIYTKPTLNNAVSVTLCICEHNSKGKTEHYHLQLICTTAIMIHYTVEEMILTRAHFYTCIIKNT